MLHLVKLQNVRQTGKSDCGNDVSTPLLEHRVLSHNVRSTSVSRLLVDSELGHGKRIRALDTKLRKNHDLVCITANSRPCALCRQ